MTTGISVVLLVIFVLDSFLLLPKGSNPFLQHHLMDGEKTGWLTIHGKLVTSKVLKGQLWRPVTSMFLHAGVPHIAVNLVALLTVGSLVEGIVGGEKLLLLFMLSGLFSAVSMMVITKIEDGLGASTAIFGLIGVWLVLLLRDSGPVLDAMDMVSWILLVGYAIVGNLADNTTRLEHLTGTLGGILFALLLL